MKKTKLHSLTFICQTFGIGGAEVVGRDLLLALKNSGVRVDCYITFPRFIKMLAEAGIPSSHLTIVLDIIGDWKGLLKAVVLWPFAVLQYFWVVWRVRNTDLILMSGFLEKILVTPIAKLFGVPVLWIEYAPLTTVLHKFYRLPNLFYSLVKKLPTKIIVPTPYTEKYLVNELQISPSRITVLPCGRYGLAAEKYKKASLSKRIQIVCVSRMEPGKGQDLLVKAFAVIQQKYEDAELIFVGEGGFERDVKAIVSELNLQKNITFLERVDDPLEIMSTATVCVFPSVWALEGFGMVTIEAMALGKPIVAFNCGPTPEIITDRETGLLARKGDVKDLAAKILAVAEDPQLAKMLGEKAERHFQKQYKFETLIRKYLDVFNEVI